MMFLRSVVFLQVINFSVQLELSVFDSIRHSADRRAEETFVIDVTLQVIVAERHLADLPIAIRLANRLNRRAVVDQRHFEPDRSRERVSKSMIFDRRDLNSLDFTS